MSNTWGMTSDPADDWRDRSACRDIDPELFYPADINTLGPKTVEAKAFCRIYCPVTGQCLAWAVDHGEDWGIWGGSTPAERRGYRSRRDQLLAEQFPPASELVQELPGVRDRARRRGREATHAQR